MVEPVAGVGESFVQSFEVGVAGVGVAVEAEVGGFARNVAPREKSTRGENAIFTLIGFILNERTSAAEAERHS
jgi:hypothetical protein